MTTPLVDCQHLTCGYGHGVVLDHVEFAVNPGEFVGIVGPSGSGKTTLLKAILGSVRPVHGTVNRSTNKVGYVPQVESVDWNFPVTVLEVITMTKARWWPRITTHERDRANDVLERLGLGGLADRHIRELSGGQQQRVFVARALFHEPDLLVLDEPTSGVDVNTRHEVLHLLADLHEQGTSIVLTTHDLNGLATHLPRLVCLNRRIIADGHPSEVITSSILEATFGAPMEVLEHSGMPVVVEAGASDFMRRLATRNAS
jgi:ABC-type Mn2+/Zn2+ transport system ATPase subunit